MLTFLPPAVDRIIDLALDEDLGNGDITTRLTVSDSANTTGIALARQAMVFSGGDIFARVMKRVDPDIEVELHCDEGQEAASEDRLITARGRASSLLMAERVALNFLQRLSGVATLTRRFVEQLPKDAKTIITDTRKTTPGLRFLERRAVVHGGGRNHRANLGGGVLIKENHIAAVGSVSEAVRLCRSSAPHPLKIEVEVKNQSELAQAMQAGVEAVLLDNMTAEEIEQCVTLAGGRVFLEASGGVTEKNVARLAQTGVDAISVGALTHSYPSPDITFLIQGA